MTLQAFWTLDLSGNWSNGADWSTQVMQNGSIVNVPIPPPNNYDVSLAPGGSAPFTVTYNTNATEHTLTGQIGSTLDITGGASRSRRIAASPARCCSMPARSTCRTAGS